MSLNSNDAGFTERIAGLSAELAVLVSLVENHIHLQLADLTESGDVDAQERFAVADPERWLENARNSLQAGVMFLEGRCGSLRASRPSRGRKGRSGCLPSPAGDEARVSPRLRHNVAPSLGLP